MILKSRKFWLMMVDVVVSLVTYFVGKYVAPGASADILWVVGLMQPVIISLIVGIAVEDAAEKRNPEYFNDLSNSVCGTDE